MFSLCSRQAGTDNASLRVVPFIWDKRAFAGYDGENPTDREAQDLLSRRIVAIEQAGRFDSKTKSANVRIDKNVVADLYFLESPENADLAGVPIKMSGE